MSNTMSLSSYLAKTIRSQSFFSRAMNRYFSGRLVSYAPGLRTVNKVLLSLGGYAMIG